MPVTDRSPDTINYLSPLGFRFALSKAPEINYFVQHVDIPDMTVDAATLPTPFNKVTYPGSKLTFGDLTLTFKVDENMTNYQYIYKWMSDITLQEGFDGYKTRTATSAGTPGGVFSDATLIVMTSSYNANKQVVFKNIYPTHLSGLTFDSTMSDINYLQATVTFAMQKYEILNA